MKLKTLIFLSSLSILVSSCGIYNSLMNLSKLKFKLGSVDNFKVGNVLITQKSKLSDFNATDILKLTSQVISGNFPVTFTVNILAKNPNTSNDNPSTSKITLESFPWSLYINDKKTISGNISKPIDVPAVESSTLIPIEMSLDMLEFFKGEGLNNLINLALSLGGAKGSATNLKIIAEPILGTALGQLKYPEPLTIVDKNYN